MLLRYLLNFWLQFIVMGFAAGAVADLTGGGGGDGTGAGDGGDSSSSVGGDSETGTEGVSDLDGTTSSGDISDAGDGNDKSADPNSLVDTGDGRKIPQKYSELFKTDKELKSRWFAAETINKTFPGGVKEAVELARSVGELGGLEGIEQIQADLGTHQADAQLFENDPAKWAEQGFKENSESALKAFAHSLEYIAENHPEHYNHLGAKLIINDLDSALPVRDLHTLLSGLKDNPQAQQLAKKLAEYYNSRADLSKKVPEKQVSAQQKALDEKGAQLTKKEQEIRNKTINTEAAPYMTRAIETNLGKVAKASGFDLAKLQKDQPNRYGRFVKDVRTAVHQNVLSDQKWLDRYSASLAQGDTAKCVRMLNARHDQAINGNGRDAGVVAPIFAEWFGPPKAATRTDKPQAGNQNGNRPANQTAGNTAALRVTGMPNPREINYSHPKTSIIDQVAMRKDGKLVTWAK